MVLKWHLKIELNSGQFVEFLLVTLLEIPSLSHQLDFYHISICIGGLQTK